MGSISDFLNNMDWWGLLTLLISAAAALLCITLHELSHGFVAWRLGDPTAKNAGRLTLNPIRHLDVVGLLMMLVAKVGWAKPVPVDMRYFKHPRQGMALTALAGPAANFLTALAAVGVSSAVFHLAPLGPAAVFVLCFLSNMALLGVGMGLFNLIPLSPLDGSKILFALLPDRIYYTILRYEKYVMGVVILLVLVGVFDKPLSFLMVHVLRGFCTLTGMEDFNGPLDLILHLLSKNRMEIKDIQISLILDQYLEWMDQRKRLDLEVASEFVTMAAHLVFIKTRMLLSIHDEEAISEMEQLIASLEEHQRHENFAKIKAIVPELSDRYAIGRDYIPKVPEALPVNRTYRYVHKPEDLLRAMTAVLARVDHRLPPPMAAFEGIVGRVVATFIAVLELCKARRLRLAGTESDCTVTCTEEGGGELELTTDGEKTAD